jgi:hypothetical protein
VHSARNLGVNLNPEASPITLSADFSTMIRAVVLAACAWW